MPIETAPEAPVTKNLAEAERIRAIRDQAICAATLRIDALNETYIGEQNDMELCLPESWEAGGTSSTVFDEPGSLTGRPATELECRQFHISIPVITFDVTGDIRGQVREKLIDLAAACLESATLLRGPYKPLSDAELAEVDTEAGQVAA